MLRYLAPACLILCSHAVAENPAVVLNVGDPAPVVEGIDHRNRDWTSEDVVGHNYLVVYFYPADMSTVCTRQALEFQKHLDELNRAGATVVGISGDSPRNHQLFRKCQGLTFPLLADPDGEIAETFGVPVRQGGELSRVINGRQTRFVRGITAQRWTFVIGLEGEILYKNTNVNPKTECVSLLKVVRQLTASAQ